MQKGKFIVFEGPDGSGKSSLATRIGEWLNKDIKKPTVVARSPGGTQYANAIRALVFSGMTDSYQAQAMGLLTAEIDCFENLILPNLQQGHNVIGDRWLMSGRIYQGFLRNRPAEALDSMIDACISHPWARPDLYIVLNASPDILMERVLQSMEEDQKERMEKVKGKGANKKKELMAQEGDAERKAKEGKVDFYRNSQAAYDRCMSFSDGVTCVTLDTSDMTQDEVYDKACEIIMQGVLSI